MRSSNQIYIPIPKARNTKCQITIGGVDVTSRVIDSLWSLPCSNGVGTFNLKISNAKGQFSGDYVAGDEVKFYADNLDNTTLQFQGRIDFTKDDISDSGQILSIDGRHRSYLLNETLICYTATDTATSTILKAIIDKLPTAYGFTYTNVTTDSTTMSVEWNYKPFWECLKELCNKAGFDSYVDNDLDFHYFLKDSIENNSDAIVEGDNFIKSSDYGTNDSAEKTRVTVMGDDGNGLPILYTAISSSEGTEIREVFIKDQSSNTMEKVKSVAEARLEFLTNKNPQAKILSFGLETLKPGDNIWIIVPRQKIAGQYKIIQINHKFGMKVGGWRTESILEELETGSDSIIKLSNTSQQITESKNIHKFNYSFNINFDTNNGTHSGTQIAINANTGDGVLETTGGTTGTWESDLLEADENVDAVELRMSGNDTSGTQLFVSVDGGTVYHPVLSGDTTISTGKDLKIKVVLNSADTQINSIALLYS